MKTVFNSLEELSGSCGNSDLKSHISSVLRSNEYIQWGFVSASTDGATHCSEFTAPTADTSMAFWLSWTCDSEGRHGHISTRETRM